MSDDIFRYCVELKDGTTTRTCWVDRKVKVNDRITLKNSDEPGRWWTVRWVSSDIRTKYTLPGGSWKVGGL